MNLRPLGPEPSALPICATPRNIFVSYTNVLYHELPLLSIDFFIFLLRPQKNPRRSRPIISARRPRMIPAAVRILSVRVNHPSDTERIPRYVTTLLTQGHGDDPRMSAGRSVPLPARLRRPFRCRQEHYRLGQRAALTIPARDLGHGRAGRARPDTRRRIAPAQRRLAGRGTLCLGRCLGIAPHRRHDPQQAKINAGCPPCG